MTLSAQCLGREPVWQRPSFHIGGLTHCEVVCAGPGITVHLPGAARRRPERNRGLTPATVTKYENTYVVKIYIRYIQSIRD